MDLCVLGCSKEQRSIPYCQWWYDWDRRLVSEQKVEPCRESKHFQFMNEFLVTSSKALGILSISFQTVIIVKSSWIGSEDGGRQTQSRFLLLSSILTLEGMKITAITTIAIKSIQFMYEGPSSSALFLKKYSVISSSCLAQYSQGCWPISSFSLWRSGVRAIDELSQFLTSSKRQSLDSRACLQ